jgi:hypothetical protein
MNNKLTTGDFSQLPHWIQAKVKELGVKNPEIWIRNRIPALGHRSIIEVSTMPEGEALLREYFSRAMGR